jgi:hypothetical protein
VSHLSDRLYAQARITPIKAPNRVKSVRKLASGALAVTLYSGKTFAISQGDELFQAFVIYTVLNDQCADQA